MAIAVGGEPTHFDVTPTAVLNPMWTERYYQLDGWRGVAAVVVVCAHAFDWSYGHDAVMLFFVISGYCIAAAASSAARKGIGFRHFMWRRIRRIYPPYLLSLLYYAATRLVAGKRWQLAEYDSVTWLQNLTLTQWWSMVRHPVPVPPQNRTNVVSVYWSLGYEEQFYLVVAGLIALSFVRRWSVLAGGVVLAVAAVVWNVLSPHWCYGFFLEYWLHFGVGAALFFRLCRLRSVRWRAAIDGVLVAFLIAGVVRGLSGADAGATRQLGREWAVAAGFALLLVVTRRFDDAFRRMPVGRVLTAIGVMSFSLYLIHLDDLRLSLQAANWLCPPYAQPGLGTFHAVNGTLQVMVHLLIAAAFWYCCERPFLNRPLVPNRATP